MKRIIYMFYVCVLLSAVSWRLAHANSEIPRILGVALHEQSGETDIVLTMDRLVKPSTRFSGQFNCLTLDFKGVEIDDNLLGKAYTGRDVKLAWLADIDKEQNLARARFYIRQDCLASVRYVANDVIVRLAGKTGLAGSGEPEEKALLNPQEDNNYSPAVISLQDAPFQPAVEELANQAGIDLKVVGQVPESFSLELEAASPVEALQGIADACKLRFYREGKGWVMSGA